MGQPSYIVRYKGRLGFNPPSPLPQSQKIKLKKLWNRNIYHMSNQKCHLIIKNVVYLRGSVLPLDPMPRVPLIFSMLNADI